MERWRNRVAVVTGASSGIGAACAKYLVRNDMIVVGLARRKERIEALQRELTQEQCSRLHAIKCDLRNEQEIMATFEHIERAYGPVAVLVNNAGVIRSSDMLAESNSEDMRATVETNVLGVVFCTREAYKSMKAQESNDGHIFFINSIGGHKVISCPGITFNIYPATKHALTAMTEVYRQELMKQKSNIKVTSISPGVVETELTVTVKEKLGDIPILKSNDVADALIYCLGTPQNVQIRELMIKPVGEPF